MTWETHSNGRGGRALYAAAALILLTAPPASGVGSRPTTAREHAVSLSATTDAASLRRVANQLGATPRVSGTPGAALAAGLIADEMRAAGLRVEVHEYEVWLPHARTVTVERLGAGPKVAAVALEPNRVVSAAATGHDPVAAGYSAAGEAVAPLVYANYGRPVDFAELRRAGVAVAGRIALIRYGGVFRGDKVRNAEAAGAVAVILYSDPEDDGYVRGAVYPDGPFRPPDAVQRGSVKVGAPGDPASPGRAALVGEAHRAPVEGLPTIPVVALGYAAAAELMEGVGGRVAPIAWQGGLPMPYNYGGSGSAVRVRVEMEGRPWRRIRNVVGTLEGARRPDEWVILGAHYDSWTHGAIDNVSGTAAMLETARVLGAQAAMGNRSDRSLLFAAWDAEEWGLVGSTEWVEEHSRQLRDGAVAYVNLDGIAGGPYFSAVASPSLRPLLLEGADAVADPVLPNTSVYRAWRGRIPNGEVGLPGGGSDYAAFASIAGVPSIGFGFSAAAGVYHSAYDTIEFMERFGDPGYRQHRSTAALATWLLWRLGNDRTPAFDYTVLAQDVVNGLSAVRRELRLRGREDGVAGWSRAWSAVGAFALAARELEGRLAAGESAQANAATLALANAHLRRAHRQLAQVRDAGVWSRSVLVAPDPQNTYRSLLLPAVAAGLRGADMRATIVALTDLAAGMEAATAELAAAERALQPARRNGVVAGR